MSCRNQKAQTTAKALYEHLIAFYSIPQMLHSDQGTNFESHVIQELRKIARGESEQNHAVSANDKWSNETVQPNTNEDEQQAN